VGATHRFVAKHGEDPAAIVADMTAYLKVSELPNDFARAIEWFMAGLCA